MNKIIAVLALIVTSTMAQGQIGLAAYSTTGAAPTMAAGAAAGAVPTCTTVAATSNNQSGTLTCTTGTAPTTGTLATITFAAGIGIAPQGCHITARNAATALVAASIYTTAPSVTSWTIGVGTALILSTAYSWSYICL